MVEVNEHPNFSETQRAAEHLILPQPKVVPFDTHGVTDEISFHRVARNVFKFPEYYGKNWSAFNDSMGEVAEKGICIQWSGAEELARQSPSLCADIFRGLSDVNTRVNEVHKNQELKDYVYIAFDDIPKHTSVSKSEAEQLNPRNLKTVTLDLSKITDEASLFDACKTRFGLPDYTGRNWDAFDESMHDATVNGVCVQLEGVEDFARKAPGIFANFLRGLSGLNQRANEGHKNTQYKNYVFVSVPSRKRTIEEKKAA